MFVQDIGCHLFLDFFEEWPAPPISRMQLWSGIYR